VRDDEVAHLARGMERVGHVLDRADEARGRAVVLDGRRPGLDGSHVAIRADDAISLDELARCGDGASPLGQDPLAILRMHGICPAGAARVGQTHAEDGQASGVGVLEAAGRIRTKDPDG
jgi:hypothetical protein